MKRIGTYVVERTLGEGGMGTVYLARSRGGRLVAVKVVRPELAADPAFRERFRAEITAARRVGGFHTAPLVDADPDDATPWLATAYIPGPTLSAVITAQGPMGERRLRQLGAALAEALKAIHACGLVHRDLKPGNIIIAEDGPRVIDFGIARAMDSTRLTATGAAFGTPGYLAPEQALGQDVTVAADIFALGAVLVAAAGGEAFGTGTPVAMMYRSVHEAPDLSAVPQALRLTVGACLAKNPSDRPTSDLLLHLLLQGEPEPTRPFTQATPPGGHTRGRGNTAASGFHASASQAQRPGQARTKNAADETPHSPFLPAVLVIGDDLSRLTCDASGVKYVSEFPKYEITHRWEEISSVEHWVAGTLTSRKLWMKVTLHNGTEFTMVMSTMRKKKAQAWGEQLDQALRRFLPT